MNKYQKNARKKLLDKMTKEQRVEYLRNKSEKVNQIIESQGFNAEELRIKGKKGEQYEKIYY